MNHQVVRLKPTIRILRNLLTNGLLLLAVWLFTRVEKGYSTVIDKYLSLSDDHASQQ